MNKLNLSQGVIKMEDLGEKANLIKDKIIGLVKFSEDIALQVIDSTATVAKAGFEAIQAVSDKANTVILDIAKKSIGTGITLNEEMREAVKTIIKSRVNEAVQISNKLRDLLSHHQQS